MTSTRPYLLRGLYEWMIDNGLTPHLLVDAKADQVEVPQQYIEKDKIILNIAPDAIRDLEIGNEFFSFSARFAGRPEQILAPIKAVMAIYAKENGEGMVFPEEEADHEAGLDEQAVDTLASDSKPNLKIVT